MQANAIFLGQIMSLILHYVIKCFKKNTTNEENEENEPKPFNHIIFLVSALISVIDESLAMVGLVFTYASSFQMLRGARIAFTGLLSLVFLKKKMVRMEWFGILVVISGLIVVSVSDISNGTKALQHSSQDQWIGNAIIVIAQVFSALYCIYMEKFTKKYNAPVLQAIGWEGLFGSAIIAI